MLQAAARKVGRMIRPQIQLDEATNALIRQRACAENKPLAAVVRNTFDQYLLSISDRDAGVDDFTLIGSVRARYAEPTLRAP